MDEVTVAKKCAENLMEHMKNYIDIQMQINKINGELRIYSADELAQEGLVSLERKTRNYRSNNEISISKDEYLEDLITTKIEIIAAIGGKSLMVKVYNELVFISQRDEEYPIHIVFNSLADGIGDWIS